MQCLEARHLLGLGVQPGAADPLRTVLGFHLSSCSACRTYRTQLHNQQLLHTLLAQEAPPAQLPTQPSATFASRAAYSVRAASAALMVGGLLALNHFSDEPVVQAADAHVASQVARVQQISQGPQMRVVATQSQRIATNVGAPRSGFSATVTTSPEGIQSMNLEAGVALTIPAMSLSPFDAAAPVDQVTSPTTYVVQPGDTLSGIALRLYGNAGLWRSIYDANQKLIGGNPGLIYPGQRLSIPAGNSTPPPSQGGTGQGQGLYTVRSGDTLSSIAQAIYGNSSLWNVIYNANRNVIGGNPGLIITGQQLTIPPAQSGQGSTVPPPAPVPAPAPASTYQVRPGDTLSAIAQSRYGNAGLWNRIYEANRNVIGGNPNLIFPGQQLTIPPAS